MFSEPLEKKVILLKILDSRVPLCNCKTLIFTKVRLFTALILIPICLLHCHNSIYHLHNLHSSSSYFYFFQEKDEICNLSGPGSDLDDFMEDDSHPVSSSDPMLSSPAPSTLSSSPSSFYSSDENLSPESIDHLIV